MPAPVTVGPVESAVGPSTALTVASVSTVATVPVSVAPVTAESESVAEPASASSLVRVVVAAPVSLFNEARDGTTFERNNNLPTILWNDKHGSYFVLLDRAASVFFRRARHCRIFGGACTCTESVRHIGTRPGCHRP